MRLAGKFFFLVSILFCLNGVGIAQSLSQASAAGFTLSAQGCLNQYIKPVNTSTNATRYEWDTCQGDLGLTPQAFVAGTSGGNIPTGIDIVFDGLNWFGFVASRETNSIIRLDFGTDITATPMKTDLGNISGVLGRPIDIKIVKEGAAWFGFVYSEATPETLITRIRFGAALTNTTSTSYAINADVVTTGTSEGNGGFDMVRTTAGWIILYTQPNAVGIIRLTDINATPTVADKIFTGNLNGAGFLGDIKIMTSGGQWFAYTVAWGSRSLHRLSFGADLFTIPTDSNITGSLIGTLTPYGIDGGTDNGNNYLFLSTVDGNLIRVNLGTDLALDPVGGGDVGNLSALNTNLKIKLLKTQSQWIAFSVSYSSQAIFRIAFPKPSCAATPVFSTATAPVLAYTIAGANYVTLRSFDASGNFDEVSKSLNVQNLQAPVLDFQNQNSCAQFPVVFTSQSPQVLSMPQWDFGNGNTSTQVSPSEVFSAAGDYAVSFKATAVNGCDNFITKNVQISNGPVADFVLPAPALSCTNQAYVFANTSSTDAGSPVTWQWNINGTPVSTSKDLTSAFSSVADQSVQLVASLPGCSSTKTKLFTIQQQGPVVDFNTTNGCQGKAIQFTNNSSGTISGYSWTFGDGNTSSALNPQNTYAAIGGYTVSLTATNALGCNNSTTKQLTIFTTPQTDFSLDLPPFSCSGSPSQFTDNTPNPTDSNLTGWAWAFGDAANGTASIQNPAYTYQTAAGYNVSLTVTTDMGCSATLQKLASIAASPVPDFMHSPACVNQTTTLTDASGVGVKSWIWKIGSTTLTGQSPAYVFTASSTFNVQLTVTGANNCVATTSKSIVVPVAQTPDFSFNNACSGTAVNFKNTIPQGTDPTIGVAWNFDGKGVSTSLNPQFVFDAGDALVTLTSTTASGCAYGTSKLVHIAKTPVAAFTALPEEGVAPLAVRFTNTSQDALSYQWHFNDVANCTSSLASPSFVFSTVDDFSVTLTAFGENNCQNTISKAIHTEAVAGSHGAMDPYPNPTPGKFHIDWIASVSGTAQIAIYTLLGEKLLSQDQVTSAAGLNKAIVDGSNLPAGVYAVVVKVDGLSKSFRLIISR